MKLSEITRQQFVELFEKYLNETVASLSSVLEDEMLYAVSGGGKRVRPVCVFLGAKAVCGDMPLDDIMPFACAIELIHSYSLVHDDLPAMDNDDFRRGRLSVHKKFGEANGILTGDQLLSLAALLLVRNAKGENSAKAAQTIMNAATDMVDGQVLDLKGCGTEREFLDMYAKKTGALIKGAFLAGALCAGASKEESDIIGKYAEHLGLAFQLADDLLDEGEENSIISVIGADNTRALLQAETDKATSCARKLQNPADLVDLAVSLAVRKS